MDFSNLWKHCCGFDSFVLLSTQYKCTWLTAISSHCLAALPDKIPAFNNHMQQNACYHNMKQWCRRRGCKRTPKRFDLSKIRAKSIKIWVKSLGKYHENSGKIPENLDKFPENPGKNSVQRCLTSKNGAQCLQKNTRRPLFLGRSHQKEVFVIFVRENLQAKVVKKLFGQIWENSVKNPSHLQKFVCLYTYGMKWTFADFLPCSCYAIKTNNRTSRSQISQPASTGKGGDMSELQAAWHRKCEPGSCAVWISPRQINCHCKN